eukprot:6189583-Pleurochrysis_carterae.AAC.2
MGLKFLNGRGKYGSLAGQVKIVRELKRVDATRPVTPRAHNYTVETEAIDPMGYIVAMRFGVLTRHTNKLRRDA